MSAGAALAASHIDTALIKQRADLLRELPHQLYKIAGTQGGEYAGPCPKCGGVDRFHAQPDRAEGARWACRQCHPKWGDVIELRMWLHGESFLEACKALGAAVNLPRLTRPGAGSGHAGGELRPYSLPPSPHRVVARYSYFDPFNPLRLTCQKERIEPGYHGQPKSFRWRIPKPGIGQPDSRNHDHWLLGRGNAQPWLYNLPTILEAIRLQEPQPTTYIVDGEKDVLTARRLGMIACCPPDGWKSWRRDYSALFFDAPVVVIPDQEHGGMEGAEQKAHSLYEFTDYVKILPALPGIGGTDNAR